MADLPIPGGTQSSLPVIELPIPSTGARWTYTELEDAFPPQPPVPEQRRCTIYPAVTKNSCYRLQFSSGLQQQQQQEQPTSEVDYHDDEKEAKHTPSPVATTLLHRTDNPSWVYYRLSTKPTIPLDHHTKGWGNVWFAVAYPVSTSTNDDGAATTTTTASPEPCPLVAIKELSKAVVTDYLLDDGPENPFVELCRLQEYRHESLVLDCWEALEDRDSLFFVSPRAVGGNLYDLVFCAPSLVPLSAQRIHNIFVQLLHVLAFLERQNIHHRDLSPDNILLDEHGRIQVMDFALSMRIPVVDGQRTLIHHVGSFGTHAYLAPEVVSTNTAFDGVAADLWSVMVIFYNLQTRHKLYDQPLPSDVLFRHLVLEQKLVSREFNEFIFCKASRLEGAKTSPLYTRAVAHLNWSSDVQELLGKTLRANVRTRWTLAQVMESKYVRNAPATTT